MECKFSTTRRLSILVYVWNCLLGLVFNLLHEAPFHWWVKKNRSCFSFFFFFGDLAIFAGEGWTHAYTLLSLLRFAPLPCTVYLVLMLGQWCVYISTGFEPLQLVLVSLGAITGQFYAWDGRKTVWKRCRCVYDKTNVTSMSKSQQK